MVESLRKPTDVWVALLAGATVALVTTAVDFWVTTLSGQRSMRSSALVAIFPFINGFVALLDSRKEPGNWRLAGQAMAYAVLGCAVVTFAGAEKHPVLVFLYTTVGLAISCFGGIPLRRATGGPVRPRSADRDPD